MLSVQLDCSSRQHSPVLDSIQPACDSHSSVTPFSLTMQSQHTASTPNNSAASVSGRQHHLAVCNSLDSTPHRLAAVLQLRQEHPHTTHPLSNKDFVLSFLLLDILSPSLEPSPHQVDSPCYTTAPRRNSRRQPQQLLRLRHQSTYDRTLCVSLRCALSLQCL